MSRSFSEQASDGVVRLPGGVAYQLLAEQRPVTNESIAEMIAWLSDDEPDLAMEFAQDMLSK